jgi:hypothetical protein
MKSKLGRFSPAILVVLAPGALALAHCGSGAPPASPDAGGSAPASLTYQPTGCSYSVTPPATRAFKDMAVDDATAPADAAAAAPQRVRIGLGGGTKKGTASYADVTTTAAFTWETPKRNTNAKVRIGTDPASLTDVHAGFVFTTPQPEAGIGFNEPETYMHEVHVCGLTAGTTYHYQVGGGAPGSEVWSPVQTFTTVPATGSKITVGIFGDARDQVSTWQLVHQRMRDAAVSLMLVSGDIVDFGTQESLYTQWLDAIWKDPNDPNKFLTLGQIPIVPIAGNHENDAARFYANFAIPGDGDYAEQYASFDVGNTHFVMVDDEPVADGPTSDAANAILGWLDADLTAATSDRTKHPFIVAINHRGLFTTSKHADDPDIHTVRGALAPMFDKYKVDLVMNGHDHEYERSKTLTAGSPASGPPVVVTTGGTRYIVNAGAGADPYQVGSYQSDYREGNPTSLGTSAQDKYIGCYVLLTLEGTKLTLNAYGLKASGGGVSGDDVIDTLTLGQ